MKTKIVVFFIAALFVFTTFADASVIQTEKSVQEKTSTAGMKTFHVTVLNSNGDPVHKASVKIIYHSGWVRSQTDKNGETTFWADWFNPKLKVEIEAKKGRSTVSTIHDEDVTGIVDISLQFESSKSKQITKELFPLLGRISTLFPGLSNFLKI